MLSPNDLCDFKADIVKAVSKIINNDLEFWEDVDKIGIYLDKWIKKSANDKVNMWIQSETGVKVRGNIRILGWGKI